MSATRGPAQRRSERPLSPHLQIYKPTVSMVMSILHRMTGVALYLGTGVLCWWLVAAATGPDYYAYVQGLLGTWPGRLVLLGFTWALIHHALGGLRHFVWDTGSGFELDRVDRMSWGTVIASILLTLILWAYELGRIGG